MRTGHCQQPDVVLKLDPVCTHVPTDRDPSTAIFRFLDSCCEPVGDMSGKAPHQATQIQDAKIKKILLAGATDKYNYKAAARSLAPVVAAAAAAAPECVEGGKRARGPPQRRNRHAQLRRWTGGLAARRPVIADTHTHTHIYNHLSFAWQHSGGSGGPCCHLPRVTCDRGARAGLYFFDASSAQICPNATGPCCLGPCASQSV